MFGHGINFKAEEIQELLARWDQEKAQRPYREIRGFKISDNQGKWRLVAICLSCKSEIEPPARVTDEGLAAVQSCDWCGCGNIKDCSEKEQENYYNPQPILTVEQGDKNELQRLLDIFSADKLEEVYSKNSPAKAMEIIVEKCKEAK